MKYVIGLYILAIIIIVLLIGSYAKLSGGQDRIFSKPHLEINLTCPPPTIINQTKTFNFTREIIVPINQECEPKSNSPSYTIHGGWATNNSWWNNATTYYDERAWR